MAIISGSCLSEIGVMVDVVFILHVCVHVFLVVQLPVHTFAVNLLNVEPSPFAVAVASPLVSLASFTHSYFSYDSYFNGSKCSSCLITRS